MPSKKSSTPLAEASRRALAFLRAHNALEEAGEQVEAAAKAVGPLNSSLAIDLVSLEVSIREMREKLLQVQRTPREPV